jgi:hypothetical protein
MLKVTLNSTPVAAVSDRLEYEEGVSCEHCLAPYGHLRTCPLINREVAEARSRACKPTDADLEFAKEMKILL